VRANKLEMEEEGKKKNSKKSRRSSQGNDVIKEFQLEGMSPAGGFPSWLTG
jgi:hypothetical protein